MAKKRVTIRDLKKIVNLIGKKGADGKPTTEREIRQWASVAGKKK